MKYDFTHALPLVVPNALWVVRGDATKYENIDWQDKVITQPTEAELLAKVEELNAAEPQKLLRRERDKRLAETDWWAMSDRVMTQEQKDYRQALRDLPQNSTPTLDEAGRLDLTSVNWPVKP
jgi:hypothetical protein